MKITVVSGNDRLAEAMRLVLEKAPLRVEPENVRVAAFSDWVSQILGNPKGSPREARAAGNSGEAGPSAPEIPDLIILDGAALHSGAAFDDVARLSQHLPFVTIFLLAEDRQASLLLDAMRAGIREVLSIPLVPEEVLSAIARAGSRIPNVDAGGRKGKILGFVACKGGSGATFLAANIGYALAAEHDKRVLLIDLDLQYGDASFFFLSDRNVSGSVAEVVRQAERMDATLLAASCSRILPNYSLLPAPEDPEEAAAIRPDQIERLLALAAANYDYVLFDIDRSIDAVSLSALDQADAIFPIMQSMVPDMRDAGTMLRTFKQLGYSESKLHFIVNRSDKKEDAPLKPIEKGLGIDFYKTIPNDYLNASASVNQGMSIVKLAPASPVSRAVRDIADDLVGVVADQDHWFRRLLRRA